MNTKNIDKIKKKKSRSKCKNILIKIYKKELNMVAKNINLSFMNKNLGKYYYKETNLFSLTKIKKKLPS